MSKEKIDNILLNHDKKYAVLMFVDGQQPNFRTYHEEIFDIATGNVIDNVSVDPGK